MRKRLLFVLISLFFFASAYAQSLSLSWTGGPIANGQNITIVGDTAGTVYSYVDCQNTSAATLTVKVKKKHITIVPGSENSFCWVTCYLPSVYVSAYSVDIAADSIAHDFSGEYKAKGNIGMTTVMYTFYDEANESDSAWLFINYDCTLGSSVLEAKPEGRVEFSNAYPNPANNQTSFTYTLPSTEESARLVIRDMVGNIVSNIKLESTGTLKVETSSLSDGVYFYSLMLDEQPYFTKKLVVKH
jgi:hypothetical protein